MFEVVSNIISFSGIFDDVLVNQSIFEICGALIIVFSVTFIDLIYRIFSHFWRGKR